jgi:hypothetical protein
MKKEIAVISVGIAIAASVLSGELKSASSIPTQVTSLSNSTAQETPLATPTASQITNTPAAPITRPATTQSAQAISATKPTINQNSGGLGGGENEGSEKND